MIRTASDPFVHRAKDGDEESDVDLGTLRSSAM
jgi:hypothetical protein